MFDYDAEMRFYRQHFRSACAVRPGERVLDVGCGGGQTTRDAGADAATHDFGMPYDVCISRFGVMFFADPVGAFRNLRRSCRRLVMMVWQPRVENEWAQVIPRALGADSTTTPGGAFLDDSPFALGDRGARDRLRATLTEHAIGDGILFDSAVWIVAAE